MRRAGQRRQHVRGPRDHRRGDRPHARRPRGAENARRGDQPRASTSQGVVEFAGGWQEAATLTRALQPPDRARLADAMTTVISDTDEPAVEPAAGPGRRSPPSDGTSATPTASGFFPVALQAARGDLDGSTDDDILPSGQLDRFRIITWETRPSASTGSWPPPRSRARPTSTSQSSTSPTSSCRTRARTRRTAWPAPWPCCQTAGRALLDPRSLAAHESEWIRSARRRDSGALRTASRPKSVTASRPTHPGTCAAAWHLTCQTRRSTTDLRNKLRTRHPPVRPHRPEDTRLRPSAQDQSAGASGAHVRSASISCSHSRCLCRAESRALPAGITNRVVGCYPALSGLAHNLAPGTYTNTSDRPPLVGRLPRGPRHSGLDLWPPMVAPWLLGCPGTRRQHPVSAARPGFRRTDKNGSSRHVLALFDSSSRRINEHSSGLLIHGLVSRRLAA